MFTMADLVDGFPADFAWGAATSSYQIEGAAAAGGRTPSIWDVFCHTPGNTAGGDTGDVACGHYRRRREDVALMREMGLTGYRFSISWPRVVPEPGGGVNHAGLDFYDALVDELLAAGIEPWPTLYHWDLPQWLEDAGGWPARMITSAFADYVDAVTGRLGDRVTRWTTLNEPWSASILAYGLGRHAPGRTEPVAALQAAHHLLLAHGVAVEVIRHNVAGALVGIAMNTQAVRAATDAPADVSAARAHDGYVNRWFFDPLHGLGYPKDMVARYRGITPDVEPGDLDRIATPIDFVGVNYYNAAVVRARRSPQPGAFPGLNDVEEVPQPEPWTAMHWPINPDGLGEVLRRIHRDYHPAAIAVTENGYAAEGEQVTGGQVADPQRTSFLREHLREVAKAICDGVPVDSYFVWSLLDNFEWAHGYRPRFGLVFVDFPTGRRTVKDSGRWYARQIASVVG